MASPYQESMIIASILGNDMKEASEQTKALGHSPEYLLDLVERYGDKNTNKEVLKISVFSWWPDYGK